MKKSYKGRQGLKHFVTPEADDIIGMTRFPYVLQINVNHF